LGRGFADALLNLFEMANCTRCGIDDDDSGVESGSKLNIEAAILAEPATDNCGILKIRGLLECASAVVRTEAKQIPGTADLKSRRIPQPRDTMRNPFPKAK
jgi:hypothetical protein